MSDVKSPDVKPNEKKGEVKDIRLVEKGFEPVQKTHIIYSTGCMEDKIHVAELSDLLVQQSAIDTNFTGSITRIA